MTFHSILFTDIPDDTPVPQCFPDLNLDQVVEAIATAYKDARLQPFFHAPLRDEELIRHRQAVARDLEHPRIATAITTFNKQMDTIARYLALRQTLIYEHHRQGWLLEAVLTYCTAVSELAHTLSTAEVRSVGLQSFTHYLYNYLSTPTFSELNNAAQSIEHALQQIRFSLIIRSDSFIVKSFENEQPYSPEISAVFAKFRQEDSPSYLTNLREAAGMNHIEAKIVEFVARLTPEPFAALAQFCAQHERFIDETIRRFDREIRFYLAYLEFIARFRQQSLPFCYPEISRSDRNETVRDGFDLALAHAMYARQAPIVLNDYDLIEPEQILVVSGPNQGGKTTFARMVGQLHYLAALGLPVPARQARLFIPDHIFTHFERSEAITNLRGKLQDELVRMHELMVKTTSNTLLILNEIFHSTTVEDATFLSKELMARILRQQAFGVWVTFIDELSRLNEHTVSMVSLVDPANPSQRPFKVVRQPADGRVYALAIARKHRLTYEQIRERMEKN
ncbi:DNA mismatch repair protein MutS [uncultured Chloroflexus sp.]|uniref:MutS-related protein n=1 Tax=uncultured Chloroflexus sp. TaxID=214040 RepID=UPI0026382CF0|nr:DNA mismatch repair protein MutS [uncultured Chloroflexus sp.]